MKKSKLITLILLVAVALVCVTLAGCDLTGQQHQHRYSNTYKSNDKCHWQVCETCGQASKLVDHTFGKWMKDVNNHWRSCEVCDYSTGNEAHVFGNWVVDVEPTETKSGSKHATCECGYEVSESIPPTDENHQHTYPDTYVMVDSTQHYQECSSCEYRLKSNHEMSQWVTDVEPTETHPGHKYRACVQECGYTEESTIPQLGTQATGTVDLYAINDFHGEYAKLAQVSGYIAGRLGEANTVAINSGDMFQGSMESNSNYGRLFSQCMDIAGFDSFTYGNHEFDWGLDNLRSLASNSITPFLGANIYNWNANSKTWGDFADDLAQEYVIKDMANGLRVGIIGVIGKDQITSISSQLVQTIGFKDPAEIIPGLSDKLRNELGCDIVVVSAHTGQSTFLDDSTWDITEYADAVFCAHTHYAETGYKNGVPFIQGGAYGRYVSHVQLYVDSNGNVSCDGYSNIEFDALTSVNSYVKEQVQMNIDNSNARIEEEASEVLTTSTGYLNSATAVPRLVAHAIADYAVSQNYQIELAMVNNARNALSAGSVTYTQLYEAIPFDNVVYIARVSGADLLKEAGYDAQSIWRVTGTAIENSSSKYYTIAVLDYLLYHQGTNREYNYFPSAFKSGVDAPIALEKAGVDMYNYRFITRDFLRNTDTVNATIYTAADNDHTNKKKLEQAVDLSSGGTTDPTQPTHQGTLSDPYSVADAILLASGYTSSKGAPSGYINGTVDDVSRAGLSSSSGDIYNVYITDGNGNSLLLYYVKKFQGATKENNWGNTSEVSVGDELLLYAESLYMYNGTPEVYNGYVVTLNGVATI